MLTINADKHAFMCRFHKPADEKRMVVILPPERYEDWLDVDSDLMEFMVPFDAQQLRDVLPQNTQHQ
jgi:putative SOS response-associated peptidase YedK